MVDEARLKKYSRKIDFLFLRIRQIEEWVSGLTEEEFVDDEMRKLATYKAFQEAVEASMDLVAMICRDSGLAPEDDFTNVERLVERGILPRDLAERLLESNRLRNILVHRYNRVSDVVAFHSIKELLSPLNRFGEMVKLWIRERLRK